MVHPNPKEEMAENDEHEAHEPPEEDEAVLHQHPSQGGDDDEDEDIPQPFLMGFHLGGRPVDAADMQRHQMAHQAAAHGAYHIFESDLNKDQFLSLGALFQACRHDEDDTAAMLQGIVKGILHVRFGFCLACGVNHQEELLGKDENSE